jgi:SAM-dependent methyltransferase
VVFDAAGERMSNPNGLTEYYRHYHKQYGAKAYQMAHAKDTGRVYTLKEWVRKYVKRGGRVIDIGCGDMFLAKELPEYEWHGIDVCSLQSEGRAVEQDLMQIPYPFEAGSFDAAICSEVLEHVWNPEVVHSEVKRLLNKAGTYLVSTPNHHHLDMLLSKHQEVVYNPDFTHLLEHIRFYDLAAHEMLLKRQGFQVVEYTGADPHFSKSMESARAVLAARFPDWGVAQRDEMLGAMFPTISHTIMLAAVKA